MSPISFCPSVYKVSLRLLLRVSVATLIALGSAANVSLAGPYWDWAERLPSDSEIQQATGQFTVPNRSIVDSRVFKFHDPTYADRPLEANGVGMVYRVPNPDYDPANEDQPDLECGRATLNWWPDRGGWVFVDYGDRRMCFSSTDTLDVLVSRYLGTSRRLGWVGEGENRPPTVTLTYSPENPTPNDTIYFEADASDPDGDPLTYKWFLDGAEQTRATAPSVRWANPTAGAHTMRVVVSDGKGGTAKDSVEFTVQVSRPRYVIMPGTGDLQGKEPIASVEKIELDGKAISASKTAFLYEGAFIKTGPGVEIVIRFGTGAVIRVREGSHYEIHKPKVSQTPMKVVYTRLIQGVMDFYWPKGGAGTSRFEIETERAVTGIKGTELTVEHVGGITTVAVREGEVEVTDKATGAVSTIRAGETSRFDGTAPPPPGAKTIEQALDANNNKIIDDLEMLQALQYWIKQQNVPGANKTIDDLTMLTLLQKWIKGTPIQ